MASRNSTRKARKARMNEKEKQFKNAEKHYRVECQHIAEWKEDDQDHTGWALQLFYKKGTVSHGGISYGGEMWPLDVGVTLLTCDSCLGKRPPAGETVVSRVPYKVLTPESLRKEFQQASQNGLRWKVKTARGQAALNEALSQMPLASPLIQ